MTPSRRRVQPSRVSLVTTDLSNAGGSSSLSPNVAGASPAMESSSVFEGEEPDMHVPLDHESRAGHEPRLSPAYEGAYPGAANATEEDSKNTLHSGRKGITSKWTQLRQALLEGAYPAGDKYHDTPTQQVLHIVRGKGGVLAVIGVTLLLLLWIMSGARGVSPRVNFLSPQEGENLLILTPMKDASPWLDEFFDNLAHLDYPKSRTSLAFLVSDSGDNTLKDLQAKSKELQHYADITILNKDFNFSLPNELRHSFEGQLVRRSFLAKSRNYLLSMALQPKHDWVLWLDSDVTRYDPSIVKDLMSLDKDIAVPNTLWHRKDSWEFWGFDRNNWQETEDSLRFIRENLNGSTEMFLIEGYRELMTYRSHLVDMPTHLGMAYVPLDGIGCTFTLVKAQVHREGVVFPTYVFDNEIETEGFAKMAKRAGFEVVGVPGMLVFHMENH